MRQKVLISLQPSIMALSSSSEGSERMNPASRNTLKGMESVT